MSLTKAEVIAGTANRCCIDDDAWRLFGFRHRPRYGSLVKKLFRKKWKNFLDKALMREILVTSLTANIKTGQATFDDVLDSIDILFTLPGYAETFLFSSPLQAITHIRVDVREYVDLETKAWAGHMFRRLAPSEIPDKRVIAGLLHGCAQWPYIITSYVQANRRAA